MWTGTAASFVDLHPVNRFNYSAATGIAGNQQVGWVTLGQTQFASLWTGTAASWVNLNPTGVTDAIAYATNGVQQAGSVRVGTVNHARLWSATASSVPSPPRATK